MVLAHLVTTKT
jgi:hypothetical protein